MFGFGRKTNQRRSKAGRVAKRNKRHWRIRERLTTAWQWCLPHLRHSYRLWPAALLAAVIALVAHGFATADRYRLREIAVPACQHVSQAALQSFLHSRVGQNIFTVDLAGEAQRLAKHPWVKTATVRRDLPGRLVVEVTEREPVAVLQLDQLYLVDSDGVPFKRRGKDDNDDLPLLTGFDRSSFETDEAAARRQARLMAEAVALLTAASHAPELTDVRLSEVRWDAVHGFSLITEDTATLILFGEGDYAAKLARLSAVARIAGDRLRRASFIDLAIDARVVVRGIHMGTDA
ncbi:MAG TPA: FtsQ-type POTRA domain-containing protein [bacterium]|nr:FtsQ-type POTRA domain-containing protein [bacterium]